MDINKKLSDPFRAFIEAGLSNVAKRHFRLLGTASGPGGGPSPTPNASFSIARFDTVLDAELIAPVSLWFRPTAITGFEGVDGNPISESPGDTNVYDPTALEIFWSWDFGDPGYVPLVPSNVPTQMRDVNRAYAKRPCHVMHSPGTKTVNLYAYDTQGNWGTATYIFGPDGDAPAISDPDSGVFAGRDLYFSPMGIFPPEVPVGDRYTTVGALNSRCSAINPNGTVLPVLIRIRLRRGEEYLDIGEIGFYRPIYVDAYGDSAAPPPKHRITMATEHGGRIATPNGNGNPLNHSRIIDQDFEGMYDSTTETGLSRDMVICNASAAGTQLLIHRVRVSGANRIYDASGLNCIRTYSDTSITNWKDYGIYAGDGVAMSLAIIGSDFAHHPNALSGVWQSSANTLGTLMGNLHGPIRHGNARDTYVAASSFFNRAGWSPIDMTNPLRYRTSTPTMPQAAYRYGASGSVAYRNFSTWERCSFEGGAGAVNFVDLNESEPSTDYQSNVLFDSNIVVFARGLFSSGFDGKGQGMAARNNYFFAPAFNYIELPRLLECINWNFVGQPSVENPSRVLVHHNSALILANNAQLGAAARVFARVNANHNPIIENNVVRAGNLSPTFGDDLLPLATPSLVGFVRRDFGTRFNFPLIGDPILTLGSILVSDRREQPGNIGVLQPGPVAQNEWVTVPYPDYTNFSGGAITGLVTRAMVESALPGGGVRYHQVSVTGVNSMRSVASAAAGGTGLVAFAFTNTAIRIQNLQATAWTGNLFIMLDLRELLMDFLPGTGGPTPTPYVHPATGSLAILSTLPVISPGTDAFQRWRAGMPNADRVVLGGLHYAGAFAGPV